MKTFVFGLLILLPLISSAYILPTRTILQKTAENAGSGAYAIEQEVSFQNGAETLNLKETWVIENDRTMRLTVSGTKEQQNTIKFQFLYSGGQRYRLVDGSRKNENISEDFLEKFFNFRSSEIFANSLVHYKIIPAGAFNKKPGGRTSADFKYDPEKWVRLSRVGGVVSYAFGNPAEPESATPGLWIEQDQFVVRKVRLPSQVEVTAENYNMFSKGLHYPRNRTIRWGTNTANIRVISAAARPNLAPTLFQPTSLDINQKVDGLNELPAKDAILEFYSRFR